MKNILSKMGQILRGINFATALIAVLTFVLGWQVGHKDVELKWVGYKPTINIESKEPPKNINVDFKLFWDTWDLLSRQYLDKKALDPTKMFYGAISGMVAAVGDPYTVFLPPDQQKFSKDELNGSFEGVGIQLGFNQDKRLVVIAPLAGTPADRAGVKPQDLIVKIDGQDTTNMSLPEAVKLIRGPKGTLVKLTIFREGETDTRDFSLSRDTIIVKSVEAKYVNSASGKKIAVIKLSRFGERTQQEWDEAITDVVSKDPAGVVLDVRNNPGGFLEGAVFVSSEFLADGVVVYQENNKGERSPFKVNRAGRLLKQPLVVLINKGSASASEIVSGALQDTHRAKLVGEKSFGKGTIQEAEDLPAGSGIHITIARWLTPNGRWVNDLKGLNPDIEVKVDPKDTSGKDIQLDKAVELLD